MAACACVVTAAEALFDAPPAGCATVGAVPAAADENHADPSLCGGRCACPGGTFPWDRGGGHGTECVSYMEHPEIGLLMQTHLPDLLSTTDLFHLSDALPGFPVPTRVPSKESASLADIAAVLDALPEGEYAPYSRGVIIEGDLAIRTEADLAALRREDINAAIRAVTGTIRVNVRDSRFVNELRFGVALDAEVLEGVGFTIDGAFGALREAGDIRIYRNASLVSMNGGFGALRTVHKLRIDENISLASMTGAFDALENAKAIRIADNGAIAIAGAFGALQSCDEVDISHNRGTESMDGAFSNLRTVNSLHIRYNSALISLTGAFGALQNVSGGIAICHNDALVSLDYAFDALRRVNEHVKIHENDALASMVNAFGDLGEVRNIMVYTNRALSSMANAFSNLRTVHNLHIENNSALISLAGAFGALQIVRVGISINRNRELTSMQGAFRAVETVGEAVTWTETAMDWLRAILPIDRSRRRPAIRITGNTALASLGGAFSSLRAVPDTHIHDNGADLVLPAVLVA